MKEICVICSKEKEINDIHTQVDSMAVKLDIIYKELMGNGKQGLLKSWWELRGSIKTWKLIAGGGGVVSIAAVLLSVFL